MGEARRELLGKNKGKVFTKGGRRDFFKKVKVDNTYSVIVHSRAGRESKGGRVKDPKGRIIVPLDGVYGPQKERTSKVLSTAKKNFERKM